MVIGDLWVLQILWTNRLSTITAVERIFVQMMYAIIYQFLLYII